MSKIKEFVKLVVETKEDITQATGWNDFEENLHIAMRHVGFEYRDLENGDLALQEYVTQIRPEVHHKLNSVLLENTLAKDYDGYEDFFLVEPYGTQNYPDIMAFTNKHIVMIESKFSKNGGTTPMWNSNVPKQDSLYVFGSKGLKDVSVFTGGSLLTPDERKEIVALNEESIIEVKVKSEALSKKQSDKVGIKFKVYPRMQYQQSGSLLDKETNKHLLEDVNTLIDKNKI